MSEPVVAIVGATGAVGAEMLSILEQRSFPCAEVRLLASARSAGKSVPYRGGLLSVVELSERSLDGVDIALFSAGSSTSKAFAPGAVRGGTTVIDNSSAFRMDDGVPLVVPEINGELVEEMREPGIIANPNCSAIIMLMALTPIRRRFGIERIVVSTYQAASGAGAAAMEELTRQTADQLAGRPLERRIFPEPAAFNVFSHNSPVDPATGRNVEEAKMIAESRKIWSDPGLRMTATCVRAPVLRAHAESINLTLSQLASELEMREAITDFPGVRIVDDRAAGDFPTTLKAAGQDDVLIGRVRPDDSQATQTHGAETRHTGFDLFVAGDQLRKGAALNAVQIAERLMSAKATR